MRFFKDKTKGLNESIEHEIQHRNNKLDERAEMNTRNINRIELFELLSSLKENLDYDYNDDFKFFRLVTGIDGNKAYLDVEAKEEVEPINGFSVEDIMYMSDSDKLVYQEDDSDTDFDGVQQEIFDEKDYIETEILPKIAKEWGFRKVKENLESIDEAREAREIATVIDTLEQNLYHHPLPSFLIDNQDDIKYIKQDGKIGVQKIYDIDQISYGPNGSYSDVYVNVIDKEDAKFAEKIADIMQLESEFVDKDPQKGYNYVFAIHVPNYVYDKPMAEFCVKNDIPAEAFKNVDSVATKIKMAQKRMNRKANEAFKEELVNSLLSEQPLCESEEDVGADITDFQKWVDYDMKHYHRISNETMKAIKEAGLSVVKDQYGDYEVIADRTDESCKVNEDTVKQGKYWVNKGKEGTHGKFRTKKAADAQRKAMFARGYRESFSDDIDEEEI